ncbi:MAG: hypothetical protein HC810_01415 [Acaryochloridaceae cyanobacterium RL_2_7]|nr:hypothetical protein [Acaryochloridaceae cyanobacterium RL_2_7]
MAWETAKEQGERSLINPFGMKREEYDRAYHTYRDAFNRVKSTETLLHESKQIGREFVAQATAHEAWADSSSVKDAQLLHQELQKPEHQANLALAAKLSEAVYTAQKQGESEFAEYAEAEILKPYLDHGYLPSPQEIEAIDALFEFDSLQAQQGIELNIGDA